MDALVSFTSNGKTVLNCLCVMRAQTWRRSARREALWWRTGLLLSFLGVCACLEDDCVVGVVGHPASLPCLHPELGALGNLSVEWRRGDEVVLRSAWTEGRSVEEWSVNGASLSADAPLTGNVSLELPTVDLREAPDDYRLYLNGSSLLCSVCLRTAASFSSPLLQKEEAPGQALAYVCHSSGGFPQPAVYWVINDTEEPPEGSVRTTSAPHPGSHLYSVTSHLTLNSSEVSRVSCVIENQSMNETLTSATYEVRGNAVANRASEAMWMFSLALCVVVGAMVMSAVVYQIHLDRVSKRKKMEYENTSRGFKRQFPDDAETEVMKRETDV